MTQTIDHYVIPTPTPYMPNPAADNNLPSQEYRVFPKFQVYRRYNEEKSRERGVPIHDEFEAVEVIIAGQNSAQPFRKVTDYDRTKRWPKEYASWKASQHGENIVGGMPIDIWPGLAIEQIISLKVQNIFTVQQLASVTDGQLGHLGIGGRELREKAKKYLGEAEKGAALVRTNAENVDLRKRLMLLETQIAQMNAHMSGLAPAPVQAEGAPAKRKGWPKGKARKPPVEPAPTTQE